ncbi:MAG: ABC transporter substrate-binding protein [Actinomycetota bacterium]|jgi:iron complex transport system substrate-binding protein|nr:ABC transporter substrate-binding protein [Actinomycetota bacterium]|tara:strand:+ start:8789 stop:9754 length:966 start_codon:yes stop_codon:yes gene_type:complete
MLISKLGNKRRTTALVVLSLLLLGASCGSSTGSNQVAISANQETATTEAVTTTTEAVDETTTTEVMEPEFPEAIISLSPTATEILFAIGAGGQVVAVDEYSTYPEEAPTTDLSGFTPNIEAIAEYEPDLVVISYDPGDLVVGLELLDIDVVMQGTALSVEDTYSQITELGELTGHSEEAQELSDSISADLASLAENPVGTGLTYFHEVDATLYTATSSTFIGQLYALLGLENIADPADEQGWGYPQLSPEYIVSANPDLIFLADAIYGESLDTLMERPGWSEITAVQNYAVIELDETSGRWGPRIVDFLTGIHAAITDLTS